MAELIFTIDAFIYLEKENKWWSFTEKARMGFLIFSAARTIFLSGIYAVSHCRKVKNLMNTLHTVSSPRTIFRHSLYSCRYKTPLVHHDS